MDIVAVASERAIGRAREAAKAVRQRRAAAAADASGRSLSAAEHSAFVKKAIRDASQVEQRIKLLRSSAQPHVMATPGVADSVSDTSSPAGSPSDDARTMWLRNGSEGWSPAVKLAERTVGDVSVCVMRLFDGGTVEASPGDVGPPVLRASALALDISDTHDLVAMSDISEHAIIFVLRRRFLHDVIYSSASAAPLPAPTDQLTSAPQASETY